MKHKKRYSFVTALALSAVLLLSACADGQSQLRLKETSRFSAGEVTGEMWAVTQLRDGRYVLAESLEGAGIRYFISEGKSYSAVGDIQLGHAQSGDMVVTEDSELWMSTQDGEFLALHKLDLDACNMETVRRDATDLSFQYYQRLDDTHLILFGPNIHAGEGDTSYHSYYVDIYDTVANTRKNIYFLKSEDGLQAVPAIYYANGLIYVLHDTSTSKGTDNRCGAFILCLDAEGNVKKELRFPDMTMQFTMYNAFRQFCVLDDTVLLQTWDSYVLAYRETADGTLEELDLPTQKNGREALYAAKGGDAQKVYIVGARSSEVIVYDRSARSFTACKTGLEDSVDGGFNYKPFVDQEGNLHFYYQSEAKKPLIIYDFL